ncbi:MAG TPA: alpha/beta hydrolase, partial [Clostridia bacterium]|nr:alpha/beta hydrolase [Clostridia bacterium]
MLFIIDIFLSLIIIMVLLLLVIGNYFFNKVVLRSKKTLLDDNHDLDIDVTIIQWEIDNKWLESQPFEDIELVAFDGLILHGYYLLAKNPTNKTVILAHGYTSKGMELGGLTKFYFEILGFNVLIPDNRGHGL